MDATFYQQPYTVHYNSNRLGVRLVGPKPDWVRPDGGDGGTHPSNVHDHVYALGEALAPPGRPPPPLSPFDVALPPPPALPNRLV